jgi:hypothetical protein
MCHSKIARYDEEAIGPKAFVVNNVHQQRNIQKRVCILMCAGSEGPPPQQQSNKNTCTSGRWQADGSAC